MNRRTFVGSLGAVGVGLASRRSLLSLTPPATLDAIGVQLYTVRTAMRQDFDGTLARVAAIGYTKVEFAGYFNRTPEQVKAALAAHRLVAPSTHMQPDVLEKNWEETIAAAHTMGHQYITMAWIDESRRKTIDDWHRIADLFNRSAETAKKAGMGFAYHNHNYEFVPLDGQLPYDILTANTDPQTVNLEIDLYWIASKGIDPLTYIKRYPGRVRMLHAKDMDAAGKMVDVGSGTFDFKRVFAARREAGLEHVFVEHDEPADAFQSITNSYNYLKGLEF
ncbi:MAG TPA: sugar phosphate isomerase/epimerase [Gemmatimonadales bacterium]|jgi:sugar phosphate isomerase/epimerase